MINASYQLSWPFNQRSTYAPLNILKSIMEKDRFDIKDTRNLRICTPNQFKPSESALDMLGLDKNDKYILMRFVGWAAVHDYGMHGIQNKLDMVKELENEAQVFITSEGKLIKSLEKYRINATS